MLYRYQTMLSPFPECSRTQDNPKETMKRLFKALTIINILGLPFSGICQSIGVGTGEKCPSELLNHIRELIKKSKYPDNINKPVLIDFWATWCSPCVGSLKAIDSLQVTFHDKFTVLSVLEKDDSRVPEVLKRIFGNKESALTFIDKDIVLHQYFPHLTIPHYVWINTDGVVKSITSDEKAISNNMSALLNNSEVNIKEKIATIPYNGNLPLYGSKQAVFGDELAYHSVISRWRPDLSTESARGDNFINCLNSSTLWLYQIAFGKFNLGYLDLTRVTLEGFKNKLDSANVGIFNTDTLKKLWRANKAGNLYTYELVVPDKTYAFDELFEIMQVDLNRYYRSQGISGHLEKRKKEVIELSYLEKPVSSAFVKTSEKPSYYSTQAFIKMVNEPVSFFLSQLSPIIKDKKRPLINGTKYEDVVNIVINDTSSINSINKELSTFGLVLREKEEILDVLVLNKK